MILRLLDLLSHSKWEFFALACGLSLGLITYLRQVRFQSLLEKEVPGLFSILIGTRALNLVLPARTGEAFRVLSCSERSGASKRQVMLAIAVESAIEIASFVLIASWAAPLFFHKIPVFLVDLLFVLFLYFGRKWVRAIFCTLLSDATDAVMVGLCLAALGLVRSPLEWFAVLVAMNLAMLIPSPGNLGTLEAGAVLSLGEFGVDRTSALAFALLYRAAQALPVVAAYSVIIASKSWRKIRKKRKTLSPSGSLPIENFLSP